MKKLFLLAVAAITFVATPVMAKEGFYIGAYVMPTVKVSGVPNIDSGSGYGFRAGFGLNRYLALESSLEMAEHDISGGNTADLTGLAVDAKINFPLTSLDRHNVMTLEPYIRLGYGINYELEVKNGGSTDGSGARFGFGVELYLFHELSVNAGWTNTNVSFDSVDADVRVLDIGLNYHFM